MTLAGVIAAIRGLMELVVLLKEALALYKQAKKEGWIQEGREIAARIKGAKTDEERKKLVRELAGHASDTP